MKSNPTVPTADLHTPEELLDNAETLFSYNNSKMMRAAVLEAITALESYVQMVVFSSLVEKLDPEFVQWLEDKTRMDFDSRLSVLVPVAIGQSVDKQSTLWGEYKQAKEIRNKVTHSGRKVSPTDVRFVIDTVYKWLAYLGSTAELELALIGLKKYIEETSIKVSSGYEAVSIISEYFGSTKAKVSSQEVSVLSGGRDLGIDLILKIGSVTTIIETKYFSSKVNSPSITGSIEQLRHHLRTTGITQGVVILFHKNKSVEFGDVIKYPISLGRNKQSNIYVVFIKV